MRVRGVPSVVPYFLPDLALAPNWLPGFFLSIVNGEP
jgi:hypothetical protein